MSYQRATALFLFAAALAAGPNAFAAEGAAQPAQAKATLIGLNGAETGTASFTQTKHGVLIELEANGLTPGAHAVHIHSKGVCEPKDKFASAGGHFSTPDKHHGFMVPDGPHSGDMPNQFADNNGRMHATFLNTAVTLNGDHNALLGGDGTAIVIHAGVDDYKSQPAGDAGGRVACGVITHAA